MNGYNEGENPFFIYITANNKMNKGMMNLTL